MSFHLDTVKADRKKADKLHKKMMKKIAKEMDYTDNMEVTAFAYLNSVNTQFDSIVAWMEHQERTNPTN